MVGNFKILSLTLVMALVLAAGTALAAETGGPITMVAVPTLNNTLEVPGTDVYYVTTNGVPRLVFFADKGRAAQNPPVAIYLNNSLVLKEFRNGH